ncbi:WbqC family protein [Ekhidna sp.]|uniref:WbqC family protein n=1 Tax=Ekhidna sp. TaxID=2608089 RepID=UPI0032EC9F3D
MSRIVIEPHYLGSLEYFVLLAQNSDICFEIHDSFSKQTFRNRAYFLSANKIQPLIVPVSYSSGTLTKDVEVDYSHRWIKDHWGAFYSAYGKSPFFEYFGEEFKALWDRRLTSLVELNLAFMKMVLKILQLDIQISFTSEFRKTYDQDHRNVVNPKKPFSDRKIYSPTAYSQLFGDTFVPNLSIVDLIMNEGPNAAQILKSSQRKN